MTPIESFYEASPGMMAVLLWVGALQRDSRWAAERESRDREQTYGNNSTNDCRTAVVRIFAGRDRRHAVE